MIKQEQYDGNTVRIYVWQLSIPGALNDWIVLTRPQFWAMITKSALLISWFHDVVLIDDVALPCHKRWISRIDNVGTM